MVSLENWETVLKNGLTQLLVIPELILLFASWGTKHVSSYALKGANYLKNLRKTLLNDKKSGSVASVERQEVESVPGEVKEVPLSRIKGASPSDSSAA